MARVLEESESVRRQAEAVREDNVYKTMADMWEQAIKKNCAKKYFGYVQFLDDDELEKFGSDWQKLVCKQVNVLDDYAEAFWKDKGRNAARTSINNKRGNTSVAIGKKFKGEEWRCCK